MTDLSELHARLRFLTEKRNALIDREGELNSLVGQNKDLQRELTQEINAINTRLAAFGKSQDQFIEASQ